MQQDILNLKNEKVGEIDLPDNVFSVDVREDILHRVVRWQLAKRQSGLHKTKTISDISGTTAKPYRQKGTGRARRGSLRSAQFRGGATIFGPVVRSHAHKLPKKIRQLGLKMVLSDKYKNGRLRIIENIDIESLKTKALLVLLKVFDFPSVLFVDSVVEDKFLLASRNLGNVSVLPSCGLNVYDVLRFDVLIFTPSALEKLKERF